MYQLQGVTGNIQLSGDAHFSAISPVLVHRLWHILSYELPWVKFNPHIGHNWINRYDCLRFHVPTSNCELPCSAYRKEFQSPHRLTKYDVAEHLQQYAANFHLNVILSATISSTIYQPSNKKWTIKVKTSDGGLMKPIMSNHFVQATAIASQKPYLPPIDKGRKTAVIGSANTAFDTMQDCYNAGLNTTMVAWSPTYIFPYEYVTVHYSIGAYDIMPINVTDKLLSTFPLTLDGQFSQGLFAHLASQEPNRYLALFQADFSVCDSRDPSVDIQHHLAERSGGHYIDVGGTKFIVEGKVAVRGLVKPLGYTEIGLHLSDGSVIDADAIVKEMLGVMDINVTLGNDFLGPQEIAARLDAT
ncbi:FAD/NAD(P)-binding domain-containing protein [Camillea tinctor]|nr:FAD/NAD(P)-binding domain-containing protein [Camillea tinctor]